MTTEEVPLPDLGANHRTQEMRQSLRRLERSDWSLWGAAVVVILALTAAVISLSWPMLTRSDEPFFQFHISQSVRGLVGLVLLFNIYTIFQQVQLKRVRAQLAEQVEIAGQQQVRAEMLLKLAMLDPLTGLHNRRSAEQRLAAEVSRSQRYGHSLTVLLLDLNDFKAINDRYGHSAGDMVLKVFSEHLTRAIRGSDLAVRLGGDEFLVLLPECQLEQVKHVLGRLTPLEIELSGERVPLTVAAGWANYQPGESSEDLLRRADEALYADKQDQKAQLHHSA